MGSQASDYPEAMQLYLVALFVGLALAGHERDWEKIKGVGPGYEKSFLDYTGNFKGGARKFLPIYEKSVSQEKDVVVKGGCGAHDEEPRQKEKRSCQKCGAIEGVGPGYEKSFLDYAGKFKGGARKFLPIYEKSVSQEKEFVVKGACGAHDEEPRQKEKRSCQKCGAIQGVGPGYEKSFLDYAGNFKGGARKFLPIYEKSVSQEKEVVVKGGCGAHDEEPCHKEKRSCQKCGAIQGVGPGYEKSFLDYAGNFKGGARKFLPIYEKSVSQEKEVVVKGGCGAHDEEPCHKEKRSCQKCGAIQGVGPGYEKSFLDYAGKFKGGARKFLPIYEKSVSQEKDVVVKGGCGAHDEEPCHKEKRSCPRCNGIVCENCARIAKRSANDDCKSHEIGVGPGYEKSYLDYAGKFKGGSRKFLPIYQQKASSAKEVVIKGGASCKDSHK